jgi:hypothetical protein
MARSFNGSTDYIQSPLSTAVTTNLSMSIWLNATATGGVPFFNGNSASNGWGFYCPSTMHILLGNVTDFDSTLTISTGVWYNFVLTITSGYVCSLYRSGTVGSTLNTSSSPVITPTGNTQIGTVQAALKWNGLLADAAIWTNTVLTQLEINALAAGIRPARIRPKSLVYWVPVEGLASPEPDISGFANNGIVTGTPARALGPPFAPITPRWPQTLPVVAAPPPTTVFRRTLSDLGTRTGSRQRVG